ncbi:sensor histidine kinase [Actinophytocola sp.]|uniref:sensor histidine kinase n=1 Tax=Actinophytocola sp. TaxID=1872138 RepID=UPI002EDAF88B
MNRRWLRRGAIGVASTAMLSLGTLDLVQHYQTGAPAALALSAVRAVPILIYRWRPLEAWWLTLGGVLGTTLVTTPVSSGEPWPWAASSVAVLAPMAGVVAAQGNRRQAVAALGTVGVLGAGLQLTFQRGDWASVLTGVALCGVGVVVGDVVHARRRVAGQLAEERQVSAAERARRSMVEERARIARELHDVVAHHMSMITVQAETARYRLAGLPEQVVAEFTGIAKLARGSLAELRGLLTALRDEQDAPVLAPQPTLADVGELVERITAAGTPVRLVVDGDLATPPSVVQLSAYRIVQEALSNVARHAGGARTTVSLSVQEKLTIEVVNAAPAQPAAPIEEGHGLVGLRERATLLGGTFEVDQPDGGWRVRVTLPMGETMRETQ